MKNAVVPATSKVGAASGTTTTIVLVSSILVQVAVVVEGFVCLGMTPVSVRRDDFFVGGCGSSCPATTSEAGARLDHSSHRVCASRASRRVRVQVGWCGSRGGGGGGVSGRVGGTGMRLQAETSSAASAAAAAAAAASAPQRRKPSAEGAVSTVNGKQGELRKLQDKLKRFASLRMWRQALTSLDKAKQEGLPLTSATYTQAINVMSKGGRWKEALELLEEMISLSGSSSSSSSINNDSGGGSSGSSVESGPRINPSIVSYNAAITACSRGRRSDLALHLLQDMRSRSGISADRYSYAAAMSGLAKAGKPVEALALLEDMRKVGVEPDFVCFSAALDACQNRGAWKEAREVIEQVRLVEPPPGAQVLTAMLTSAIGSCGADGEWEQAMDYLTDIRLANGGTIAPASAYAAAANACARAGQGVRAQALIAELAAGSGERPDVECYNAVVYGFAMTGDLKGALRTLKEDVVKAGLKPNTRGFNHAIAGCARAGEWKMALDLLDELRSGDLPNASADRDSFNAALDACGRSGQVEPAVSLLDTMRSLARSNRRLKPDRYSYSSALQACREAADYKTALDLLGRMKGDGVRAEQRSSLAAVAACAAAGRGDEAADVLEGMVAARTATSDGARVLAREACVASSGGGGGAGFERAMAALDLLDLAAVERTAVKAEKTKQAEKAVAVA